MGSGIGAMSGRARLTVCAAAASVMAGFALLPLTATGGWFLKAVLLVCLQSGVGAAARRAPLARPLTILVQALVSLVVLTMMFAQAQALGGILPGPAAVRQLGQVVQDGMNDVSNFAIPAPVTSGIGILLIGGTVIIALAVDAIAVTYNSAAPAGLPLLALYSVAAGLATGGARWLYFLVAASGYLLLLLAEGRDRLSRWGRVFSSAPPPGSWAGGPASASAGGGASAPVRTGRRIGAMALGLALVVPVLLPSLGGGLLDRTGNGSGNGIGGHGGGAINLVAALQDNLNQPDNREVLSYRTDSKDVPGMYLRIAALDKFDGKEWSPSKQPTEPVPALLPQPQGMAPDVKYKAVNTSVRVDDTYVQGLLPMPFPALSVQTPGELGVPARGPDADRGPRPDRLRPALRGDQHGRRADGRAARRGAAGHRAGRQAVHAGARLAAAGGQADRARADPVGDERLREGARPPAVLHLRPVRLQHPGQGRHRGRRDRPLPPDQAGLLRPLRLHHGGDGPHPGHPGARRDRLHPRDAGRRTAR